MFCRDFFSRLPSNSVGGTGVLSLSCAIRKLGFSSGDAPDENQVVLKVEYEKTLPLKDGELDSDVSSKVSVQRRNGVPASHVGNELSTGLCITLREFSLASVS